MGKKGKSKKQLPKKASAQTKRHNPRRQDRFLTEKEFRAREKADRARRRAERKEKRAASSSALPAVFPVFGVLATGILLSVFLLLLFRPAKTFSEEENRNLAAFPEFSLNALAEGRFTENTETYFEDQFPLRSAFQRIRTELGFLTGVRESNGVYYLNNGRLAEQFSEPDETLLSSTAAAVNAFASRHPETKVSFLLVPDAGFFYQEEMPKEAENADQGAYMDRFLGSLSGGIQKLDVRDVFSEGISSGREYYYRTDHHWTSEACLTVFRAVQEEMDYPDTPMQATVLPVSFSGSLARKSGFRLKSGDRITLFTPAEPGFKYSVTYDDDGMSSSAFYDLEKLYGSDAYELFFSGNHSKIRIETTADNDRTLLLIKDSYANSFLPFLLGEYRSITVIDPRYYAEKADDLMRFEPFTDVLFLYNANTLSTDTELKNVLQ